MKRHKLFKKISFLVGTVFLLPVVSSCRDEVFLFEDEVERIDNRPVVLEVHLPETTRGVNPIKTFPTDAMLHVMGTFLMDDGSEEIRYGGFTINGDQWEQKTPEGTVEYDLFAWPNNCVTAEFKAYYVKGANTLLVPSDDPGNNPVTTLSEVVGKNGEPDSDPLVAYSSGPIKYGHTIVLNFIHACSYLTVEDMPPGMANRFWFTQLDANQDVKENFYNAFRLHLNTNKEMELQFIQKPDPDYGGLVYVEGASQSVVSNGVEKAYFSVFLAPGQYSDFVIGYPGMDEMQPYMYYQKKLPDDETPGSTEPGAGNGGDPGDNTGDLGDTGNPGDNDGDGDDMEPDIEEEGTNNANPFNILKENGVYRFNLSKSAGVNILTPPPGEVWDDSENPIYPVDAEEFLYKVCNPAEYVIPYKGEQVKILEVVGSGTRLCENVNMQWAKYDIFAPSSKNFYTWFQPDLVRGNTFDGDHHYIWNLGSPLFHTVNGTVKNLGLTNADMSFVTRTQYLPDGYEQKNENDYFSLERRGAICNYVQYGTIENIRIRSKLPYWYENNIEPTDLPNYYNDVFNINAYIYSTSSQESHSIGCLVGSNLSGTINRITICCDITLNVANAPSTSTIPTLNIGGIIGQSVSTLINVSTEDKPTITINNVCSYQNAAYYIGGITGYHSGGTINNVILPDVMLMSRGSSGFTSYMGGMAGGLSNAQSGGELLNCSVAGSVYAGKSSMNNLNVSGASYTGGVAGECYESYILNGCLAKVNVYGPTNNLVETVGVTYGTGGVFGRVVQLYDPTAPVQTPVGLRNITFSGSYLVGPSEYIGRFAGIVPTGETWEDDYADNDILITYTGSNVTEYIGTNQ